MAKMPPKASRSFRAIVRATEEEQRKQRSTSPFFGTGMHPTGSGGMAVDGTMTVGGQLNVTGDTVIGGTLSLPAGIINNDALANPTLIQQGFSGTSGFSLSVAGAYIITINKNTPAGFTEVVVTAFGRVVGQNSTGSADSLYTTLTVAGVGPNQFPTGVGSGNGNTSSVGFTTTVTGLTTGQVITTGLFASTGLAGWAASGANAADLSVTYSWSR